MWRVKSHLDRKEDLVGSGIELTSSPPFPRPRSSFPHPQAVLELSGRLGRPRIFATGAKVASLSAESQRFTRRVPALHAPALVTGSTPLGMPVLCHLSCPPQVHDDAKQLLLGLGAPARRDACCAAGRKYYPALGARESLKMESCFPVIARMPAS
ncbi:Hypothetical predicted protein [Marmota monax]|uniref:Uncharacterized protein n=1 Tax=Marmota monax TaxID=9995 RepID=A0A5E4CX29_MARMO|nr:Hypothetical predicted protein [Marmota monax]